MQEIAEGEGEDGMNSLSWLIYLADVVDRLNWILSGLAPFFLIGVSGLIFAYFLWSTSSDEADKRILGVIKKGLKIFIPMTILLVFLLMFVPSKKTVILIVASEFGEDIAQSDKVKDVGNKAYLVLDKMLSEYLEEGRAE